MSKSPHQRIAYIVFLILLFLAIYFDETDAGSDIDLSAGIPLLFLAVQSIINNKYLWLLFCALAILGMLFLTAISVKGILEYPYTDNIVITIVLNCVGGFCVLALLMMRPPVKKQQVN